VRALVVSRRAGFGTASATCGTGSSTCPPAGLREHARRDGRVRPIAMDAGLGWERSPAARPGPACRSLKGVLHPADARLAVEHGVDGLVARTTAAGSSTGDRRAGRAARVAPRSAGGCRSCSTARAARHRRAHRAGAGASASLVGRPVIWGSRWAAPRGAARSRLLRADLDRALALTGVARPPTSPPTDRHGVAHMTAVGYADDPGLAIRGLEPAALVCRRRSSARGNGSSCGSYRDRGDPRAGPLVGAESLRAGLCPTRRPRPQPRGRAVGTLFLVLARRPAARWHQEHLEPGNVTGRGPHDRRQCWSVSHRRSDELATAATPARPGRGCPRADKRTCGCATCDAVWARSTTSCGLRRAVPRPAARAMIVANAKTTWSHRLKGTGLRHWTGANRLPATARASPGPERAR